MVIFGADSFSPTFGVGGPKSSKKAINPAQKVTFVHSPGRFGDQGPKSRPRNVHGPVPYLEIGRRPTAVYRGGFQGFSGFRLWRYKSKSEKTIKPINRLIANIAFYEVSVFAIDLKSST